MSDKAAALKEKLANLKRKRQDAISANHKDVSTVAFWKQLSFCLSSPHTHYDVWCNGVSRLLKKIE